MAKLNRRRGNRFPVSTNRQIAVYAGTQRLEGVVIDESVTGLGALFPRDCGLREQQKVKLIFRRSRQDATVTDVRTAEDGDSIGFALNG